MFYLTTHVTENVTELLYVVDSVVAKFVSFNIRKPKRNYTKTFVVTLCPIEFSPPLQVLRRVFPTIWQNICNLQISKFTNLDYQV